MVALFWVNPTQRPSENFSDGLNFESIHFYRLKKFFEGTGQFGKFEICVAMFGALGCVGLCVVIRNFV